MIETNTEIELKLYFQPIPNTDHITKENILLKAMLKKNILYNVIKTLAKGSNYFEEKEKIRKTCFRITSA